MTIVHAAGSEVATRTYRLLGPLLSRCAPPWRPPRVVPHGYCAEADAWKVALRKAAEWQLPLGFGLIPGHRAIAELIARAAAAGEIQPLGMGTQTGRIAPLEAATWRTTPTYGHAALPPERAAIRGRLLRRPVPPYEIVEVLISEHDLARLLGAANPPPPPPPFDAPDDGGGGSDPTPPAPPATLLPLMATEDPARAEEPAAGAGCEDARDLLAEGNGSITWVEDGEEHPPHDDDRTEHDVPSGARDTVGAAVQSLHASAAPNQHRLRDDDVNRVGPGPDTGTPESARSTRRKTGPRSSRPLVIEEARRWCDARARGEPGHEYESLKDLVRRLESWLKTTHGDAPRLAGDSIILALRKDAPDLLDALCPVLPVGVQPHGRPRSSHTDRTG